MVRDRVLMLMKSVKIQALRGYNSPKVDYIYLIYFVRLNLLLLSNSVLKSNRRLHMC